MSLSKSSIHSLNLPSHHPSKFKCRCKSNISEFCINQRHARSEPSQPAQPNYNPSNWLVRLASPIASVGVRPLAVMSRKNILARGGERGTKRATPHLYCCIWRTKARSELCCAVTLEGKIIASRSSNFFTLLSFFLFLVLFHLHILVSSVNIIGRRTVQIGYLRTSVSDNNGSEL